VVVTELALVTEVDHLPSLLLRQPRGFKVMPIDGVEERREGGAQGETPPTVVAFLEDSGQFLIKGNAIQKLRIGERRVLHKPGPRPFKAVKN